MLTKYYKLIVFGFFVSFLVVGIAVTKDYGINWDEPLGRDNGLVNAAYIAKKLPFLFPADKEICPGCPHLSNWPDADHGPIFELIPTFIELGFNVTSLQQIYFIRHLTIFAFFFIGVWFFYLLLQQRFNRPWVSLGGAAMLVASPRIFADGFYNAKDIPFLVLFIVSSYTLFRFLDNKSIKNAFWHGLACGLAIAVRILGILTPVITIGFIIISLLLFRKKDDSPKKVAGSLLVYLLFFALFTVVFWPYLWEHSLTRFLKVLESSSSYPWGGSVLYDGVFYMASETPWHYLSNWMFITTPVFYTILFFVGAGTILFRTIKTRFQFVPNSPANKDMVLNTRLLVPRNTAEQKDLVMLLLFLAPFLANLIFRFVLYDSWRLMYFMYVPFLYLAIVGLVKLYDAALAAGARKSFYRYAILAVWFLGVGYIGFWMVKNHPYQYVYFSTLKGEKVRSQYELDYWGLSYKQALEHILKINKADKITIFASNLPGFNNQWAIPEVHSRRLAFTDDPKQADYMVTNFRWHPQEYTWAEMQTYNFTKVHAIVVDGITIMAVYKLK